MESWFRFVIQGYLVWSSVEELFLNDIWSRTSILTVICLSPLILKYRGISNRTLIEEIGDFLSVIEESRLGESSKNVLNLK